MKEAPALAAEEWAQSRRVPACALAALVLLGCAHAAQAAASVLAMSDRWNTDIGHSETLDTLQGRYVILSMFYTSCRRICPQSVNVMRQAQRALRAHGIDPEMVLVSYAAEQESPLSLADFRERQQLDAHWHLLAGSSEETRDFANRMGLEGYNSMDEHIFHDFAVVIVMPDGREHFLDWHHRDAEALVNSLVANQR